MISVSKTITGSGATAVIGFFLHNEGTGHPVGQIVASESLPPSEAESWANALAGAMNSEQCERTDKVRTLKKGKR